MPDRGKEEGFSQASVEYEEEIKQRDKFARKILKDTREYKSHQLMIFSYSEDSRQFTREDPTELLSLS